MGRFDRATGIGGSDAAAILGLSPFRTRQDVWLEKVRHPMWRPKKETAAMRWGNILEPVLRAEYEQRTRQRVSHIHDITTQPEWHPNGIQFGHFDGRVHSPSADLTKPDPDVLGLWEGKAPLGSEDDWFDDTGQVVVPIYCEVQIQQYLAITGLPWCDVSALLPSHPDRMVTVRRPSDPGMQLDIEAVAVRFWRQVQSGDPVPDLPAIMMVPQHDPLAPYIDDPGPGLVSKIEALALVRHNIRAAKEQEQALRDEILLAVGDAPGVNGPGWRLDAKTSLPARKTNWESVAVSLWNTIEIVRRHVKASADLDPYLDPDLFNTLVSLYTTTDAAQRPIVLREVKE